MQIFLLIISFIINVILVSELTNTLETCHKLSKCKREGIENLIIDQLKSCKLYNRNEYTGEYILIAGFTTIAFTFNLGAYIFSVILLIGTLLFKKQAKNQIIEMEDELRRG